MSQLPTTKMNLPFGKHPDADAVREIYHSLAREGHSLFVVGGAVRDWIREVAPKDLDLVTSASPEEIEKLFPQTIAVGKAFGVMIVVQDKKPFELATLRTEGQYQDGRHPTEVRWGSLEEDVLRRDFTINSLYFEPLKSEVIDLVGGLQDLRDQVLRTVGTAEKRFEEDHLRVLRAYRFRAQTGFAWDPELERTLPLVSSLLERVSRERIREELARLFTAEFREKVLPDLARNSVLEHLFTGFRFPLPSYRLWKSAPTPFHELVLWCLEAGQITSFRAFLEGLRLSKEERRLIDLSFEPWREIDKLQRMGLSEFTLKLWEPAFVAGLEMYLGLHPEPVLQKLYAEAKSVRGLWGKAPPEAWIRAKDLEDLGLEFKGAMLGAELKRLYHLQILGGYRSREELIAALKVGLI